MNPHEMRFRFEGLSRPSSTGRGRNGPAFGVVLNPQLQSRIAKAAINKPDQPPSERSIALRHLSEDVVMAAANRLATSRELISASHLLLHYSNAAAERHRVRMEEKAEDDALRAEEDA